MTKPERVFKMGAVRASVFRNTIQHQGKAVQLPKVVIEVRYRDKAGNWQGTNSLSLNDLPKAIAALQQAYEYLLGEGARIPDEYAPSVDDAPTADHDHEPGSADSPQHRSYKPRVYAWPHDRRV